MTPEAMIGSAGAGRAANANPARGRGERRAGAPRPGGTAREGARGTAEGSPSGDVATFAEPADRPFTAEWWRATRSGGSDALPLPFLLTEKPSRARRSRLRIWPFFPR